MKTSLIAPFVLAFVLSPGFALAQTSFTDPSHASMDQITPGMGGSPGMSDNAAADQINAKQAAHDQAEDSQVWPTANAPKPAATTATSHVNKKKSKRTAKHTHKTHKKAAATTAPAMAPAATPAPAPAPVTPAQ